MRGRRPVAEIPVVLLMEGAGYVMEEVSTPISWPADSMTDRRTLPGRRKRGIKPESFAS